MTVVIMVLFNSLFFVFLSVWLGGGGAFKGVKPFKTEILFRSGLWWDEFSAQFSELPYNDVLLDFLSNQGSRVTHWSLCKGLIYPLAPFAESKLELYNQQGM